MNNDKRNIHNSGPLGMLMKNGQIKKITPSEDTEQENNNYHVNHRSTGSYFKTQSGIEFSEQELIYVNPEECESWIYANRQENELGDIDGLIDSIKTHKQLQPALIRHHPTPHGDIKYEVIFGRRRHIACLKLGIPFLAIRKQISNIQDAVASQDAENKLRNDVSNYSNAMLYRRLLADNVFKSEKELADKLKFPTSTLNDLMAYSKIPEDIVKEIPNIHTLSKQLAVKLVQLLNKSKDNHQKILKIAGQIGKKITSQTKLKKLLDADSDTSKKNILHSAISHTTLDGKKLFTSKSDYRGLPSIVFNKEIVDLINFEDMCHHISSYLEKLLSKSQYLD
jgi:ParB family chromosome partitioning protein